jgi:hypothetical protein
VTTGVWARAILQEEYGVDLSSVTWVLSGDEHVAQYRPPANVVPVEPGRTLEQMFADGELAAVIGVDVDSPDVAPLIPEPDEAGFAALQSRGLYPINHLVVVKDELLAAAPALFEAFAEAKRRYLAGRADDLHRQVAAITGHDPLPYGIEPNRHVLAALIDHAVDQHILDRPPVIEELFARGTWDLSD